MEKPCGDSFGKPFSTCVCIAVAWRITVVGVNASSVHPDSCHSSSCYVQWTVTDCFLPEQACLKLIKVLIMSKKCRFCVRIVFSFCKNSVLFSSLLCVLFSLKLQPIWPFQATNTQLPRCFSYFVCVKAANSSLTALGSALQTSIFV